MSRRRLLILSSAMLVVLVTTIFWFVMRERRRRVAFAKVSAAVAVLAEKGTCLKASLCGEIEQSKERMFNPYGTAVQSIWNQKLTEVQKDLSLHPELVTDAKKQLRQLTDFTGVISPENTLLLTRLLMEQPIDDQDVKSVVIAARRSASVEPYVIVASSVGFSDRGRASMLDGLVSNVRDNSPELEEQLAALDRITLNKGEIEALASEACSYRRQPRWQHNLPWIDYYFGQAISRAGIASSLEAYCTNR